MPTLAAGTLVPGLYSHVAESEDKENIEIPQPFKCVTPKQNKGKTRGKPKQQQSKQIPQEIHVQQDQYSYEDPNNYHTENYRGQPRTRKLYRGQTMSRPFRTQAHYGRGQHIQSQFQSHYNGNNYHSDNYQGNHEQFHYQSSGYSQLSGRNHGHGRGNYHACGCSRGNFRGYNTYQYQQYYSHDNDHSPEQYGPSCTLCGGYNPKHCFKGEHDISNNMENMNINPHQSQQSILY